MFPYFPDYQPLPEPTLVGSIDAEILQGGDGADYILGEGGDDHVDGGFGDDILTGGAGSDVVIGGEGNDTLYAQPIPVDYMDGLEDVNVLIGGGGDDRMSGGTGYDYFAFGDASGYDVITNFDPAKDTIAVITDVNGTGAQSAADLALWDTGWGVIVDFGAGNMVELQWQSAANLSEANFLFI